MIGRQLRYRGTLLEDMPKEELIEAFIYLHEMHLAASEDLKAVAVLASKTIKRRAA